MFGQKVNNKECWNGKSSGSYEESIVEDGISNVLKNPELKFTKPLREPSLYIEHSRKLVEITKQLKSAHKGESVQWWDEVNIYTKNDLKKFEYPATIALVGFPKSWILLMRRFNFKICIIFNKDLFYKNFHLFFSLSRNTLLIMMMLMKVVVIILTMKVLAMNGEHMDQMMKITMNIHMKDLEVAMKNPHLHGSTGLQNLLNSPHQSHLNLQSDLQRQP